MKIKERRHVKLYKQFRRDIQAWAFVVTWYPSGKHTRGGVRKRAVFIDRDGKGEKAANAKADEIEKMMARGMSQFAAANDRELAAFLAMREQLAPGIPLTELLKSHINGGKAVAARHGITCAQVCSEFRITRSDPEEFSKFQIRDVKRHTLRLEQVFGKRNYAEITGQDYEAFLKTTIGGSGRNKANHLTTYRAMSRWARDKKDYLPQGRTAAENCADPKVVTGEHEVYTPEEFKRLLAAAPAQIVIFYVLGGLAGIRSEERTRLLWSHYRQESDGGRLILNADVTKTSTRRRVEVCAALERWLLAFRTQPEHFIVPIRKPAERMGAVRRDANVPKKNNALRASFASYHLEMHDDAARTALNDGHSPAVLQSVYRSLSGVTKAAATEWFNTTPEAVIKFAREHGLPQPSWADRLALRVLGAAA